MHDHNTPEYSPVLDEGAAETSRFSMSHWHPLPEQVQDLRFGANRI
jgi:hypothetical protein